MHARQGGAREVHQIGEGHVPSMRNCSDVCCRNKRNLCSGSWPPPRMMFADYVVLCVREKDVLGLELEKWREALEKRGIKESRATTEYMYPN